MPKREVFDCDRCGREIKQDPPSSIGIETGERWNDPVEGAEDATDTLYLCPKCLLQEYKYLLNQHTVERRVQIYKRIKDAHHQLTTTGKYTPKGD